MRRRRQQGEAPVNVSAVNSNLVKLSTGDLYEYVETSLMSAGYHVSQWRVPQRVHGRVTPPVGGDHAHLEQAIRQTEWALEGLRALQERN